MIDKKINKNNALFGYILFLLIGALLLVGCSNNVLKDIKPNVMPDSNYQSGANNSRRMNQQGYFNQSRNQNFNQTRNQTGRMMNLTPEERQKMMEARQELEINFCKEKTEGDTCSLQDQRGEMPGTCRTKENILICQPDIQNRQRP